jgi:nucleotide-binding universal stress UspA family protein
MLKILLPVDFSEGTYKTCKYALQLCTSGMGAHLLLINCFQDYLADADTDVVLPLDQTPSVVIAEDVIHRNETAAFEQLENLFNELQASLPPDCNIYLERKMIHGSPEDCIPEQLKEFKADLLVMHTDGESGLGRSIFGTITTKMVDEVKVPVLTVPKEYTRPGINKVLYATDFDAADVEAVQQLRHLINNQETPIICVHIADDTYKRDKEKLIQLQQQLQQSRINNVRFILLPGNDVADALLNFVQEEQIDLISLTNRDHSIWNNLFNQNLTKKLVLESQIPLLIFHG